ncbi:MAG: DNA-3-methyladenine glycosylase family protein [Anaerovoracaceae bacterium]|jgi:DNA-3-methyladenine glycosylase II
MSMYFEYGDREIEYLKDRDPKLGEAIDAIGHVYRPVDPDLFSSVVHQIIGQQISIKAQQTIWERMRKDLGEINAESIDAAGVDRIQSYGTTFIKAGYICDFAGKVLDGSFDIKAVSEMPDDEAVRELTKLKGIGTWTAEMILLFCLQRPDILSFDDLAIIRGMRMIYHHRKVDRKLFEKYRRRYSPYGSVASLYIWEVACGAIPGMKDWAPKKK